MSLIRSKARLALDAIIADNPGLPYTPTVSNSYIYDFKAVNANKSECKIKGRFGNGYRGRVRVVFNKLDVSTLTLNCKRDVIVNGGTSTLAYLPVINARFGFDLKPTEIVDYPVINNGTTCRLTIQPECVMYRGTVDLDIHEPLPDLHDLIGTRELPVATNPSGMGPTTTAAILTMGHDYSALGQQLVDVAVGSVDVTQAMLLSSLLQTVDTVPWGIVADTLYSLVGAEVLYNGPPADATDVDMDLVKLTYARVLIIETTGTNTELAGSPLVIHYNIYSEIRS